VAAPRRPAARDRGLRARAHGARRLERVHARVDPHPPAGRGRGGHRRGRLLRGLRPGRAARGRPRRCRSRGPGRSRGSATTWPRWTCGPRRPRTSPLCSTGCGPTSPRRWTSRCARRAGPCTRRSTASRDLSGSWSPCGSASRRRSIPCGRGSTSIPGCSSSSTPRRTGTTSSWPRWPPRAPSSRWT
jgi:hypothetical protein